MASVFSTPRSRMMLGVAVLLSVALLAVTAWLFRPRAFLPDASLDERTYVQASLIPGAGNGLFAARDLKKGEVIAEMGGQLVNERLVHEERGYLFMVPPCAKSDVWPYDSLDGFKLGGHGSKINFAPRRINGVDTNFQNAKGREMCKRPYVFFEATRDIAKGEEIIASYGPDYDYGFMEFPSVRDHFCGVLKLDCTTTFDWKP